MKMQPIAAVIALALASSPAMAADKPIEQQINEARLEGQIGTAIVFNRHLNPFEISVDVEGQTAILTGVVDDAIDKELAERVAMNAKGITKVDNRISVDSSWQPKPRPDGDRDFDEAVEDASITASVKSRLLWNDVTDGLEINVDTHKQRVSLNGKASTQFEKDLAGRLAINTDGVRAVDNRIVVSPGDKATARTDSKAPIEDSWITAKVKASLLMSKNVDGLDLTVETKNGVVMLGGLASSNAERDLAKEIAADIRGVKRVDVSAVAVGA